MPVCIGSIGFNLLANANQTISLEPVYDESAERIFFTRRAGNIAKIKRESANLVRINLRRLFDRSIAHSSAHPTAHIGESLFDGLLVKFNI
jgi:hypothetical protein